ncbi:Uncharacterized protein PECH_004710 [Penicillium ucsense]|uniref:Uncharacterized protein n=1 Tax=Penicillium ucsense TaxID=2839758 RepID=A0A8J8WIQ1_9EURO|nr:Uncharacterized protein PECM_003464 [Penicillium ucsense]KAF7736904.1 Uncharacterized protein PECH_004710 [Penicillium ucsense]
MRGSFINNNHSTSDCVRPQSQSSITSLPARDLHQLDHNRPRGSRRVTFPLVSKFSRSSSKLPTPLNISQTHHRSHSASVSSSHHDIERSLSNSSTLASSSSSYSYFDRLSDCQSSAHMTTHPLGLQSPQQEQGSRKRSSTMGRKTSDDNRRYHGTVQQCGRHANDWLFGGFSVRETVRDSIDKLRRHDKES